MIEIVYMTPDYWEDVRRIYLQGIATGNATFETTCPEWETWNAAHRKDCRLVARKNGQVAGWAALSDVSGRCVYAGVAEISIYVDENHKGQKVGDIFLTEVQGYSGPITLMFGIAVDDKITGFKVLNHTETP